MANAQELVETGGHLRPRVDSETGKYATPIHPEQDLIDGITPIISAHENTTVGGPPHGKIVQLPTIGKPKESQSEDGSNIERPSLLTSFRGLFTLTDPRKKQIEKLEEMKGLKRAA